LGDLVDVVLMLSFSVTDIQTKVFHWLLKIIHVPAIATFHRNLRFVHSRLLPDV
jgi:hypothetical protein